MCPLGCFEYTLGAAFHEYVIFIRKIILLYPFSKAFVYFGMKGNDSDAAGSFAFGDVEKVDVFLSNKVVYF